MRTGAASRVLIPSALTQGVRVIWGGPMMTDPLNTPIAPIGALVWSFGVVSGIMGASYSLLAQLRQA